MADAVSFISEAFSRWFVPPRDKVTQISGLSFILLFMLLCNQIMAVEELWAELCVGQNRLICGSEWSVHGQRSH